MQSMDSNEIILSGPKADFEIYSGSLSDFIFDKMKSRPLDHVAQINAETGDAITTQEFLKFSAQISEGLIELGLKIGDVVALAGRDSHELHASAMGILWGGGVFAAVEPDMKIFEMQLLYNQLKPRFVICEPHIAEKTSECLNDLKHDANIVVIINAPDDCVTTYTKLESILRKVDVVRYRPRHIQDPAGQLAMIICSSGSSGIPKGVGLTHRNIIFQHFLLGHIPHALNPIFTTLQITPFFWITGTHLTFLSYVHGATRIFMTAINEKNILEAIHKYKPRQTMLSPSLLLSLLNYPEFQQYDVRNMQSILAGGSSVSKTVVDRMKTEWKGKVTISQVYGMTETAGITCITSPEDDILSVGALVQDTHMKIIDVSTGKSLGPNQLGELIFRCPGIMKQYVGNEEGTKAAIDKDGWYHSGDLGYYTQNERIYVVGRIKETIEFGSEKIAPAEVETFILSLPGVKEVGVVGIPNENDINHLMAIVVRLEDSNISAEDITQRVKESLADYKQLRGGVYFVQALPRTTSGKIKRTELKELGLALYNEGRL